jgi:hypothetical protein
VYSRMENSYTMHVFSPKRVWCLKKIFKRWAVVRVWALVIYGALDYARFEANLCIVRWKTAPLYTL